MNLAGQILRMFGAAELHALCRRCWETSSPRPESALFSGPEPVACCFCGTIEPKPIWVGQIEGRTPRCAHTG